MAWRWSSTSATALSIVVNGLRSSWLTSAANRASLRILSCRAEAVWLKDKAMGTSKGSPPGSIRASRSPSAKAALVSATRWRDRSAGFVTHHPNGNVTSGTTTTPMPSTAASTRRLWSSSCRGNTSKYASPAPASGSPTTSIALPPTSIRCRKG